MYQLDQVGRLAPSSSTLSREAAARHAQLAALGERRGPLTDDPARPRRWFAAVGARLSWQ